ncbi:hypothetical protein CPY51_05645 [Rhizobium tubonense]|uniref:Uncharacterized protein n=1 Tax=Rhizobium tubonense TaxID=484088 RepID=A0A2W4CWL6_9HYPH|nr:hypothetical protein CPY51_05645 [Rhizobium tubonense]
MEDQAIIIKKADIWESDLMAAVAGSECRHALPATLWRDPSHLLMITIAERASDDLLLLQNSS